MGFKIAIDGPAGAGKSYLASQLALSLGILNVNTGAIYRAYALYMLSLRGGYIPRKCSKRKTP